MTEEDYKKLRCSGPYPENTGTAVNVGNCLWYLCSGSLCAAWVWEIKWYEFKPGDDVHQPEYSETEGHCGLIKC